MTLLEVNDLHVWFSARRQTVHAVKGITFEIHPKQAVGLVGESGSGKSATAQAICQLTPAQVSGTILFEGKPIINPGKEIGMVFQDPMSSLNPTMKIGAQISEGLIYHKMATKQAAKVRAIELLELVGIKDAPLRANQYPHQFSGGMRQRVLIAIAIACTPKLLIADEPTTALDKTLQVQILNLIKEMQVRFEMGLLFISHDIGAITMICDHVLVMYEGLIVERGSVKDVIENPKHPYTQMLLSALPQKRGR